MSDEDDTIHRPFLHPRLPGPFRIGQRILDKALDRDLAIAAAQQQAAELKQQAAEVERLRAELDRKERKELYDRVIERFNRSHSHRKKTTLKEICDEMNVSYEAVRKHRQRTGKRKG